MNNNELVLQQNTNNSLEVFKSDVEYLSEVSNYLVQNKLVPSGIKPHEISLIVSTGKELGMNPITSVNNIDIIQGRVCIQAKVIPALLASKGVYIDVIKDYEPVIEKVKVPMKDPDTGKVLTNDDGSIRFYKNEDGTIVTKDKIVDYVTELEFIRNIKHIGLTRRRCVFKWSMAVSSNWHIKDNWQKMPAYMMMARCISRGARLYAADAINSMYDNYEMIDAFVDDSSIIITEDGDVYKTETKEQDKTIN